MGWKNVEPKTWKPEKADERIEGVIIGREAADDYSAKYYLKDRNGDNWLVWGCAVLDQQMKLVQDDELVRITYEGQGKNSKGQAMNLYTVQHYESDDDADVKPPSPPSK